MFSLFPPLLSFFSLSSLLFSPSLIPLSSFDAGRRRAEDKEVRIEAALPLQCCPGAGRIWRPLKRRLHHWGRRPMRRKHRRRRLLKKGRVDNPEVGGIPRDTLRRRPLELALTGRVLPLPGRVVRQRLEPHEPHDDARQLPLVPCHSKQWRGHHQRRLDLTWPELPLCVHHRVTVYRQPRQPPRPEHPDISSDFAQT